jgi:catechol 2,3-dioxygenase
MSNTVETETQSLIEDHEQPAPEAFSLHPATRLGPVHLSVADLERQITFYRDVLGFKLHGADGATVARLGAGGEDLLVLTRLPDGRRVRGATGLYHLAVLFPSRRELARALARLFALLYPNYPTDHVMTETTYLDDPEGNGIELYADTPERGTWGIEGGELVARDAQGRLRSGRDPLDVEALLRELQPGDRIDEPLPEGAKMGHVHLHVGDLDEAVGFYHGVLGFDVQIQSARMQASFVSAGGYHHHIGLNTWLGQGVPPPPPGSLGLRHFTVVVPDEAELGRLVERLAQAGIAAEKTEAGLLVRDPSQNGVLLTTLAGSGA